MKTYKIEYVEVSEDKVSKSHLEFCRSMFNEICIIYDDTIVRLIGYHEDLDDCYYRYVDVHGNQQLGTMVGGCYSLKPFLPIEKYDTTDNLFEMNGGCKSDRFIVTYEKKSCIPNWEFFKDSNG